MFEHSPTYMNIVGCMHARIDACVHMKFEEFGEETAAIEFENVLFGVHLPNASSRMTGSDGSIVIREKKRER